MKLLLSALLSLTLLVGYAQQPRTDQLIPVNKYANTSSPKSLEAKFTADVTQGVAPLSVQFTDQSTGNPTSWKWIFGDGDSSLVQNPLHIYQAQGLFTVKLTISDGINGFALEKKDYIRVINDYINCDTLHYPLPEPLTYYAIPDKGYVTGNNSYGDKAVCDYFDNMQPNLVVTGIICEFSIAKQVLLNNEKIMFNTWKSNISTGKPGIVLASDTILLSELVADVANNRPTTLDFDTPVQPGGSFFMGVMLPVLTGDTLCLWSTGPGMEPINTTWIQQSDDIWESAQVLYPQQGGLIISCAIYPKICVLNSVDNTIVPLSFSIWPNPAKEILTIVNQQDIHEKAQYTVSDISGKELINGNISKFLSTTVDVSMLKPGIYILRVSGKESVFSSKLVIN